ncbi:MAG: hypothetical protein J6T26_00990 [Firmicutes bacterium]|nr:hypothetical protein [Bacillota bacterium]
MKRKLWFCLTVILALGLLLAGCGQEAAAPAEAVAADAAAAEYTEAADDSAAAAPEAAANEAAAPSSGAAASGSSDGFVEKVVAICASYGIERSFNRMEQHFLASSPEESTSYRTICDRINGERDPGRQIVVDEYEDTDIASQEFALYKEQEEYYSAGLDIVQVFLNDDRTIASYMDAYGEQSNIIYIKLYENCIVSLVASQEEYFDTGLSIIDDIEALTAQ